MAVSVGANFSKTFTAIRDATSPAAWPPIPSATAISWSDTKAESSFPWRTKPIAERAEVSKKCALMM